MTEPARPERVRRAAGGSGDAGPREPLLGAVGNRAVAAVVQGSWEEALAIGRGAVGGLALIPGTLVGLVTGTDADHRHGNSAAAFGIELMGKALTDEEVVEVVRLGFMAKGYTRGLAHLDHYLAGGGVDYVEDVGDLIARNPKAAARIAGLIAARGSPSGRLVGHDDESAPIRKAYDYDDRDWWSSLGNVDEIDYEVLSAPDASGHARVRLGLRDPYEWHPLEDRDTQPLHEAFEDMKTKGTAQDYLSVGSAEVLLPAPHGFPGP